MANDFNYYINNRFHSNLILLQKMNVRYTWNINCIYNCMKLKLLTYNVITNEHRYLSIMHARIDVIFIFINIKIFNVQNICMKTMTNLIDYIVWLIYILLIFTTTIDKMKTLLCYRRWTILIFMKLTVNIIIYAMLVMVTYNIIICQICLIIYLMLNGR